MAHLELRGVRKTFGAHEVIKGVDLTVEDTEFVVFVGPSGCGKSTLLRMIAGLESITNGDLLIDGVRENDSEPTDRGLAMVFQSYALYPHMTVAENMGFALRVARVPRAERDRAVQEAARILELEALLDRRPKDLSGGQRQRVAIGRAIVRDPKVFLFDEPLSNLDAALRVNMRLELLKLHERLKATMIYVTHDQVEAMTMADKIVVLRAGLVEQIGAPMELYNRPANLFVAGFIGAPQMNFLPPEASEAELPEGVATLGVRPEHLRVEPAGAAADGWRWSGRVELLERLGGQTNVHVLIGPRVSLVAQADGNCALAIGEAVALSAEAGALHFFDRDGLRRDLAPARASSLSRPAC
jgi:multiple sugar transport system ATP-binding protein